MRPSTPWSKIGDAWELIRTLSVPHTASAERLALWMTATGVAAVAGAVRVSGALHYAFWQDEVASARIMLEATPLGVARQVGRTESTPPVWYALGWLVHRLGVSVTDVRLLSVIAGALLAAAVVFYARSLLPLWASGLAGLAVALGYQFVFHGRELRAYELHALLSVGLAIAVSMYVAAPGVRKGVALALLVAAGALTIYFFLLSVASAAVWLGVSRDVRGLRRRALLWIGAGLVPFVVWSPVMVLQYRRHRFSFIGPFDGHAVLSSYYSLFARAEPRTSLLHDAAPLLVLAGVVAGSTLLARRSDRGLLCALLALVPLAAATLVWLAGQPIFDVRNLIGAGPFAAIALAALAAALPRVGAGAAACLAAALLVYGFSQGDRVKPAPYDRVADALVSEGWSTRDPVILFGNFYAFRSPLEWYLPGQPALTLGEARKQPCTSVFVVALGSAARNRTLHASALAETRQVRGILVARLGRPNSLTDQRWRGSHILVAKAGHASCVHAVPEELVASRL